MSWWENFAAGLTSLFTNSTDQALAEYTVTGVARFVPEPGVRDGYQIRVSESTSVFAEGEILEVVATAADVLLEMAEHEGRVCEFAIKDHGNDLVAVTSVKLVDAVITLDELQRC